MKKDMGSIMVVGEALFDIFPDGKIPGGASFNFAFHLNGLGLPVIFISRVGKDDAGSEILDFARRFNFPIEGIQVDPEHPTGEVLVTLDDNGVPDFDIVRERAYDFIETNAYTESMARQKIRLLYIGTLIQRSPVSSEFVKKILASLSLETMVLTDLNLRAPFFNRATVEFTLQCCDILKISAQEMEETLRLLLYKGTARQFIMYLQENYEIGSLCVTKGERGSEFYETGTFEPFAAGAVEAKPLADTVGAGDAFVAMMTVGLTLGWHKQKVLEKAAEFSARVCELPGALPAEPDFYKPFKVQ